MKSSSRIRGLALRYAQRGVRSRKQLQQYLERYGLAEDEVERVLKECRDRKLIDDPKAAGLWAAHWARLGFAWEAIRQKLRVRGFEERAIAAAGRALGPGDAEEARARALVSAFCERRGAGPAVLRGRLIRLLAARGYSTELIEQVLESASSDLPASPISS